MFSGIDSRACFFSKVNCVGVGAMRIECPVGHWKWAIGKWAIGKWAIGKYSQYGYQ
jgi:hypothetical protein